MIAEQLNRFDTIGIDCVAMNVNDLICVGAEPLAMLDYLAVDVADPEREAQIGLGLRDGAELAGIEIPGGELAQLGEVVRGFDIAGACFGVVALDQIIAGDAIEPGDSIIGIPSRGLHANGYTLARAALNDIPLDSDPDGRLGRSLGEELLLPTEIYVKAILDLLRSEVEVHGLAHITSEGLDNLLRLSDGITYLIENELPVLEIFNLIRERASVDDEEMYRVFNMGCGFCCVIPQESKETALKILRQHYEKAQCIGHAIEADGEPRVIRSGARS
jgi:phosphoribosylformylglycinamidine cyclo-ligase